MREALFGGENVIIPQNSPIARSSLLSATIHLQFSHAHIFRLSLQIDFRVKIGYKVFFEFAQFNELNFVESIESKFVFLSLCLSSHV